MEVWTMQTGDMSEKETDLVKGMRENFTEQHFLRILELEELSKKAFQIE